MNISLRYRYDGSQLCAPIGAMVDSASTPVQVPVAIDAQLQIEVISAWTRRPVSPATDMAKASDWRFAIFDRYGDGNGMVFATRTVQTTASGWLVPWKDSGTAEMYEALGEDKARIFVAELQGYESSASALPISVLSFPFRVGNRRGDIVTISPLETFAELDPVATKLLEAHEARRDNPHVVTAKQVGALPAFVNENASQYQGAKYVNDDSTFLRFIYSRDCHVRDIIRTNRVLLNPVYSDEEGGSTNGRFPVINGGVNLQHFDIGRGVDDPNTTYADVSYDFIFRRGVQALAGIDISGDAAVNGKVTALSITNGGDITDVFASLRFHEETLASLIQSTIPNLQDAGAALQSTIASLQERIAALEAANA